MVIKANFVNGNTLCARFIDENGMEADFGSLYVVEENKAPNYDGAYGIEDYFEENAPGPEIVEDEPSMQSLDPIAEPETVMTLQTAGNDMYSMQSFTTQDHLMKKEN